MAELERLGTAQNVKIYQRHGVQPPLFGVSYAHLGKLAKKIRTDHTLAQALWETGSHDARVLATSIADPAAAPSKELDGWVKDVKNYVLADALSKHIARTPHAEAKMKKWTKAKDEWSGRVGWLLLVSLAKDGERGDNEFPPYLDEIEKRIHKAPNRTRDAMLYALIAIGMRGGDLEKQAVAAAKRIGAVDVDHGETGCKTPDPIPYIQKGIAHRKKMAAKRKK